MTSSKKLSPPENRKSRNRKITACLGMALMGALLSLSLFIRSDWDRSVVIACVGYTVLASIFLGVQIWGFVVSQTYYSDAVEEAKFRLIELEEIEWGV